MGDPNACHSLASGRSAHRRDPADAAARDLTAARQRTGSRLAPRLVQLLEVASGLVAAVAFGGLVIVRLRGFLRALVRVRLPARSAFPGDFAARPVPRLAGFRALAGALAAHDGLLSA